MTTFRHSATTAEITAVMTMSTDLAQARVAGLSELHDEVFAYNPNHEDDTATAAEHIAHVLRMELVAEHMSGQFYHLGPSRLGGVALWAQRVGTVRPPYQPPVPIYKSEDF